MPFFLTTATTLPIADRLQIGAFREGDRGPTRGGRNGVVAPDGVEAASGPAGRMRGTVAPAEDTTGVTGKDSRDLAMRGRQKDSIAASRREEASMGGR